MYQRLDAFKEDNYWPVYKLLLAQQTARDCGFLQLNLKSHLHGPDELPKAVVEAWFE